MVRDNLVFTTGIDGKFICEINRKDGSPQDLSNCTIQLLISYIGENDAILVLNDPIINQNICIFTVYPYYTEYISMGEYDVQLIIEDMSGRRSATKRQTISIENIIKSNDIPN